MTKVELTQAPEVAGKAMTEQNGPQEGLAPRSPEDKDKIPSRVTLTDVELQKLPPEELVIQWRLQDAYVTALERRLAQQEGRYSFHEIVEFYDYQIINYEFTWIDIL